MLNAGIMLPVQKILLFPDMNVGFLHLWSFLEESTNVIWYSELKNIINISVAPLFTDLAHEFHGSNLLHKKSSSAI